MKLKARGWRRESRTYREYTSSDGEGVLDLENIGLERSGPNPGDVLLLGLNVKLPRRCWPLWLLPAEPLDLPPTVTSLNPLDPETAILPSPPLALPLSTLPVPLLSANVAEDSIQLERLVKAVAYSEVGTLVSSRG